MDAAQKHALKFMFEQLFQADEPEAMLSSFKRIAEIQAYNSFKQSKPDMELCRRWLRLTEILTKVEDAYSNNHNDY